MAGLTKQLLSAKLRASITEEDESDEEMASSNVPFSQKSHSSDIKYCDHNKSRTSIINKENENSPKRVSSPRSKIRIPLEDSDVTVDNAMDNIDTDQNNNSQPVTPTKPKEDAEAPLTPTANLKMLFSAVSPEIRKMQSKLKEEANAQQVAEESNQDANDFDNEILCSSQESDSGKPTTGSRKEKSLGLLCQKFLQKYPEYPDPSQNFEICLDEVAKELSVERRRIYDIVNVLESVEIVSRVAKNRYAWHGKTNLVTTLAKLRALAETEGFAEQMDKLKELELNRELQDGETCTVKLPVEMGDKAVRKDKSLGIMSQKFLMLFLVSKPKTVNLDLSAKILIGDPLIDRTESAKFKTKIRRLYDIANILTSLDLIRKVHVTEIRGRKPAFKYIGPDVDNVNDVGFCCTDGCHRPSSRHSMLDCVKNANVANLVNMYRPIHPCVPVQNPSVVATLAEAKTKVSKLKQEADNAPRRFSRHASFEQICQVAEKERSKLYGCSSEPSSPVKKLNFDETFEDPLPKPELKKSQSMPLTVKKPLLIMKDGQLTIVQDSSEKNKSNPGTPLTSQTISLAKSSGKANAFIFRTKPLNPSENMKQPTMIPLTRDQIDAVLRSLKVPVPMEKDTSSLKDASTQSSPNTPSTGKSQQTTILEQRSSSPDCTLAAMNETTPQAQPDRRGIKRTYVAVRNVNTVDKRIRLAIPTPPSTEEESGASSSDSFSHTPDGEVDAINQRCAKRKVATDRRALHLAPEFRNSPPMCNVQRKPTPDTFNRITASELELAAPLADDEDSPCGKLSPRENSKCHIPAQTVLPTMQRVTIQLPNQQPMSVFHVPVNGQDKMPKVSPKSLPQSPPLQGFAPTQPLQIVGGIPVTPNGQPMGFMVPVTFSPPLTPSSPTMFTMPTPQAQQNMTFTSVHVMQPQVKVTSASIPSSVISSPLQTFSSIQSPQVRMIIPPEQPITTSAGTFIHKDGSLFTPIAFAQDTKTAVRKLSLSDLC
ncbi:transcription factor E2F8-like isoform X1 [Haliotis cracherodii]|uniref:transcription factor E2F8-like isoform X1 n=1 Tax=Haliotis cracherodii TaxID=6455 RepID=UPI0039ECBC45